jgi:hypothetical protein
MNQIIKNYYYDNRTGFTPSKLYSRMKHDGIAVSKEEVDNFLKRQRVNQILKPINKLPQYNTVFASKIRENYQIDLMIYDRYEYFKYKYILCAVDTYSRYADARPLTNKTRDNEKSK